MLSVLFAAFTGSPAPRRFFVVHLVLISAWAAVRVRGALLARRYLATAAADAGSAVRTSP